MRKHSLLVFSMLYILSYITAQDCIPVNEINDNFESYAAGEGKPLPECWTKKSNESQHVIGVRNTTGEAYSGNNYLSVYTFFAINSKVYIISPEISNIDGAHQANFYINSTATSTKYEWGIMTDANNTSTFQKLSETENLNNNYQNVQTGAIENIDEAKYFAIKLTIPNWHTVVRIDDFMWEQTEVNCNAPIELQLIDSTSNSLIIGWDSVNFAQQYIVEYGLNNFTLGDGEKVNTATNSIELTNLEDNSNYDIYIKTICDSNNLSEYSNAYQFSTANELNVGINNNTLQNSINIYPNPIPGDIFYVSNSNEYSSIQIDIYQVNGQHILNKKILKTNEAIEISQLSSGIYFIQLTQDQNIITKK